MAERKKRSAALRPAERLAAIEERQARLLAELDQLNERVESVLRTYGPQPEPAAIAS